MAETLRYIKRHMFGHLVLVLYLQSPFPFQAVKLATCTSTHTCNVLLRMCVQCLLSEVCVLQVCCPCSRVLQRPSHSSGVHQEVRMNVCVLGRACTYVCIYSEYRTVCVYVSIKLGAGLLSVIYHTYNVCIYVRTYNHVQWLTIFPMCIPCVCACVCVSVCVSG